MGSTISNKIPEDDNLYSEELRIPELSHKSRRVVDTTPAKKKILVGAQLSYKPSKNICNICEKKFCTSQGLASHKRNASCKQCTICRRSFLKIKRLEEHEKHEHLEFIEESSSSSLTADDRGEPQPAVLSPIEQMPISNTATEVNNIWVDDHGFYCINASAAVEKSNFSSSKATEAQRSSDSNNFVMQDRDVSDSGNYESEGWPQSSSFPRNSNCIGQKANTSCSPVPSKSSKGMSTELEGTELDELEIGETARTSKNPRETNHEPGMFQDQTPYFSSQANEPIGIPSGNNHQNPKSGLKGEDSAHDIDRERDIRDDSVNRDVLANEIDSDSHESLYSVKSGPIEKHDLSENAFESQRLTPESFGIQSHLLNTEDKDPDENESSDYESIAVDHKEVLRARGIPETGVDDSTDVDDEDHFEIDTNQAVNNADDEVVEVDDENTKFAISETDEKVSCNQCNIIRAMMRKNMLAADNGIATSKIEEREFFGYIMCSQCEEREGNDVIVEETSEVHRDNTDVLERNSDISNNETVELGGDRRHSAESKYMEQGRYRHPDLCGIQEGTKSRDEGSPGKWKRLLCGTAIYNR